MVLGRVLKPKQVDELVLAVEQLPIIVLIATLGSKAEQKAETEAPGSAHDRQVFVCGDITVEAELRCVNANRASSRVSAPRWGRPKDFGWWLVLGSQSGELLAIRRTNIDVRSPRPLKVSLSFPAPRVGGPHVVTLYLVSDCACGLDQQSEIPFFTE